MYYGLILITLSISHLYGCQKKERKYLSLTPTFFYFGACWKDTIKKQFITLYIIFDKSLFICDLKQLLQLQLPNAFNIDWTSNFVCFVVSMRIELANLWQLCKDELYCNFVNVISLSPLYEVIKHFKRFFAVKFACTQKT